MLLIFVSEPLYPSIAVLEARLAHDQLLSGTMLGKCELSQSVKPEGKNHLSSVYLTDHSGKSTTCSCLLSRGLGLILTYKGEVSHARVASRNSFSLEALQIP